MNWRHGLSSRVPALQVQSPKKKKKQKMRECWRWGKPVGGGKMKRERGGMDMVEVFHTHVQKKNNETC
jgi:hypothetical protein